MIIGDVAIVFPTMNIYKKQDKRAPLLHGYQCPRVVTMRITLQSANIKLKLLNFFLFFLNIIAKLHSFFLYSNSLNKTLKTTIMKVILGQMLIVCVRRCLFPSPPFHNLNITTESILCFVEMYLDLQELFKY